MYINKDSIYINGISMGQYLTEVTYQYPKYWGEDTGRNLAGTFGGTLLGIFPKLILQFGDLTQSQIELLAPIFDNQEQSVTYYDPFKKANYTFSSYSGDWEITFRSINHAEPFKISFIDRSKRA